MKVGDLVYVLDGMYFGTLVEWSRPHLLWVNPLMRADICHERCTPGQAHLAHMTFVGPVVVLPMKKGREKNVFIATYNQKTKTTSRRK